MRALLPTAIGAVVLAAGAWAAEGDPREWQGALDLRRAVTIKSEHVGVNPPALAEAGLAAGSFTPPKRVKGSSPSYPEAAARDGAQGTVLVDCLIRDTGAVEACRVVRPVHPAVDRAVVDAIRRWKYEPARVMDEPRSIVAQFMMIFRLQ
ncbi:MAG TPA: energy transducer TonB [Vicinamibacteria bacterium]|nr:energy transducer TonB [Vicinamibacteria bacterium]